ncbi:hypothetical protein ACWT_2952 [Actinoplanes sp. SE50]|uniref:hypothetical protein n=1 Tax=unclassified Actinoplanes TaxID=2626549 RepID=UPI00023EBEDE|nr:MULTISPECIES: hypothetical protein [unclassified Actinoplanes]AEV83490.1 hypothetical protein ACPL_2595 [Actinoplanes sp. SE50/110]ATO82367.1 hypothetical protein ACWT_2952 [Actinoplanes sp. SE50]SLL99774.1 hypothetical protein ACSP50_3005 [Actinoplanes sp. SE50/110]
MRTVTRRVTLWRADLEGLVCPVAEEIAEALIGRDPVMVVLEHRVKGITAVREVFETAVEREPTWRFSGIGWPADVQTGTVVTVTWQAGRDAVVVRTRVLDDPMRIDGVNYYHEYDPLVVTRDFDPRPSNRGQVLKVIRGLGRVFEDGSAVFPEDSLAGQAGLGRGQKGTFLLKNAVDQLIREGYVTRVTGSTDADGLACYPAVDGQDPVDLLFYAPLVEPAPHPHEDDDEDDEHHDRREHWVKGFIRKLPPGAQPSERQMAAYQWAVENELIDEDAMGPGYTYVKKHHRNG